MLSRFLLAFSLAYPLAAAPPLVVIALDGVRWDYAERDHAANLLALKKEGASVEALVPAFSATTFPNFYAMATGLYPEHHGIVAMAFYDRAMNRRFFYATNAAEGEWYGGLPIWLLAESQGVKAATYFWPGSDAAIQGKRATYWKKYDGRVTHEDRIKQVFDWLKMPEGERPGFITVYFSDVDSAGHRFGPDSQEVRDAMAKVDATVGTLVSGIRAAAKDANIVLVSDHGMATVESFLDLTPKADLTGCIAANEMPMTMLYCKDPERVRKQLIANVPEVNVWRKNEVPEHLHYRDSPRIGDLIVTPRRNLTLDAVPPDDPEAKPISGRPRGMHGYDPERVPEMRGILIGVGPAFRQGFKAPAARTVDVYLLLCALMGWHPAEKLDGDFNRVKPLLQ